MYEYLNDTNFLTKLDLARLKIHYLKMTLLSFKDEQAIQDIQGTAISGNLSINGNSAVRRTINFAMLATEKENQLTNLDNLISLNKKIKVQIGYKNIFYDEYPQYGRIIWFPCGIFIITSAKTTNNTQGITINISGQDKMVLLNGKVGGNLPAMTIFHELYNKDKNGDILVEEVKIVDIIKEAVNHLGGEKLQNIIINDLKDTAKLLVKYRGDKNFYFSTDKDDFIISSSSTPPPGYPTKIKYDQDVGYMETDFTYPGELILQAGNPLTGVLDKICQILGNYEYFYDIQGRFVFQEIKNYLNKKYNLTENNNYVKYFSDSKYLYSLENSNLVLSYNVNPKYENIKNDFIVWGKTNNKKNNRKIRYHLAIDKRPEIDIANKYFWAIKKDEKIIRYESTSYEIQPSLKEGESIELIGTPCEEWREELYRQALIAKKEGSFATYYDRELLAEWRQIYDTIKWPNSKWNPEYIENPNGIYYWLDFIDTGSYMGAYSVDQIGRRTKVINDDKISTIFNRKIPDVIFIQNQNGVNIAEKISKFIAENQKYCFYTENQRDYFHLSSTGMSAFEKIKDLLFQHLTYNLQITVNAIPCYYLEPNHLIRIKEKRLGIDENFVVTSLSIPLAYNGTMSIQAVEALNKM